jgi:ADP-ribose pyrophosphatase
VSTGGAFRILGARDLGDYGFLRLEELDVSTPSGPAKRFVVRHPGAVAMVPIHAEGVVLIRQYRAPVDRPLLELPAGKLDVAGEPPEETAARELEEEIGYRPDRLDHIMDFFTGPGFTDEFMRLYAAYGLRPVPPAPTGPEEAAAEIVIVPRSEIGELLSSGEVVDAKTIIGLQWLEGRAQ